MGFSDFTTLTVDGIVGSNASQAEQAAAVVVLDNPTVLDIGADGRLYIGQRDGLIYAVDVEIQGTGASTKYVATSAEEIKLVKEMPNHDDDGSLAKALTDNGPRKGFVGGNEFVAANTLDDNERQVTGMVTTTDADGNVVLYISSSDPRESIKQDVHLDTNSGVISRLTFKDGAWEKVDIVRGLPRSEENHATNGLELSEDGQYLFVASGGNTNKGAQDGSFANTAEYYYSAAILRVDLDKIATLEAQGLQTYNPVAEDGNQYFDTQYSVFDLPTLNDPTRPDVAGSPGVDQAGSGDAPDVFGGNNGLNQAIYDPSGTVEVYSPGYRNIYDVAISPDGQLYTYDNGPNTGIGGKPVNSAGDVIVDANNDGIPDNGPATNLESNEEEGRYWDQLHLADTNVNDGNGAVFDDGTEFNDNGEQYYGGHPNPTRAYGGGAGLYLYSKEVKSQPGVPQTLQQVGIDANGNPYYELVDAAAPVDLAGYVSNINDLIPGVDPRQAVYAGPWNSDWVTIGSVDPNLNRPENDPFDGSLDSINTSTNGLEVYTYSGVADMDGVLLATSFDGRLYGFTMNADGTAVTDKDFVALFNKPLDVVAQDDGEPFEGTIWVAGFGAQQIIVMFPGDGSGSGGGGLQVDANDRDGDNLSDVIDPFPVDPSNGANFVVSPNQTYTWTFENGATTPNSAALQFNGADGLFSGGATGFTGLMLDREGLPETLYDPVNMIYGGAPGILQIKDVDAGEASTNDQRSAHHFGLTPAGNLKSFIYTGVQDNFFDELDSFSTSLDSKISQGIYVGAGDQNNYVSVSTVRLADGSVGIEVNSQFSFDFAGATPTTTSFYAAPELALADANDGVELSLEVNVDTYEITPTWSFTAGGQTYTGSGASITPPTNQFLGDSDLLRALKGELELGNISNGVTNPGIAVGVLASYSDADDPYAGVFTADWDELVIEGIGDTSGGGGTGGGGNPGDLVRAINVGMTAPGIKSVGGQLVTTYAGAITNDSQLGIDFEADDGAYYTGATSAFEFDGAKVSGLGSTSNTALDGSVFHTYRNGADFTGSYAVANGDYVVELHVAELYWEEAGRRVADYYVEGQLVADDLDIFAVAGLDQPYTIVSTTVTVTDGFIDVQAIASQDNAVLSGISIYAADNSGGGTGGGTSTITAALQSNGITVTEGAGAQASFTIQLSEFVPAGESVTIDYATVAGGATEGLDYTGASGSVTINGGQGSATVTIDILDDGEQEANETFSLQISNAQHEGDAVTITNATQQATIQDDGDTGGSGGGSGNNGGATVFEFVLGARSSGGVNPIVDVYAGSTLIAADYEISAQFDSGGQETLVVTADVPSFDDVSIVLKNDNGPLAAQVYSASIDGVSLDLGGSVYTRDNGTEYNGLTKMFWNGSLVIDSGGNGGGAGAITVDISPASTQIVETTNGQVTFDVTLSSPVPTGETVTVDYATAAGSATDGADYTGQSGTLTFTAGQTSQSITIDVLDDSAQESNETFSVQLSNAQQGGAALAINTASATTTILDDDGSGGGSGGGAGSFDIELALSGVPDGALNPIVDIYADNQLIASGVEVTANTLNGEQQTVSFNTSLAPFNDIRVVFGNDTGPMTAQVHSVSVNGQSLDLGTSLVTRTNGQEYPGLTKIYWNGELSVDAGAAGASGGSGSGGSGSGGSGSGGNTNNTGDAGTAKITVNENWFWTTGTASGPDQFVIENTSSGGEMITSVTYNLNGSLIPDAVVDIDGQAGDLVSLPFAVTTAPSGVSATVSLSDGGGAAGYKQFTVDIAGGLAPGESLAFQIDVDPNSIAGAPAPGANTSGSISGLEMAGTEVTVNFQGGASATAELFAQPISAPNNGSNNIYGSGAIALPGEAVGPDLNLSVQGVATSFEAGIGRDAAVVADVEASFTAVVTGGTPGEKVALLVAETGGLGFDGSAAAPLEFGLGNKIVPQTGMKYYVGTFDSSGEATIQFSGTSTPEQLADGGVAGINYIAAAQINSDGVAAGPVTDFIALIDATDGVNSLALTSSFSADTDASFDFVELQPAEDLFEPLTANEQIADTMGETFADNFAAINTDDVFSF